MFFFMTAGEPSQKDLIYRQGNENLAFYGPILKAIILIALKPNLDQQINIGRVNASLYPSKHFLKTCKQMFDKMSSVSSKNVKTNL